MRGYFAKGFSKHLIYMTVLLGLVTATYAQCNLSPNRQNKCGIDGGCGYTRQRCIEEDGAATCSPDSTCGCNGSTCNLSGGLNSCVGGACTAGDFSPTPPGMTPYRGKLITSLPGLLGPVAQILYYVGLFGGILAIIYSGYLFITSAGEPHGLDEAKAWLSSALFGLLFIILTRVLMSVILKNIIGADPGF